MLFEQQGVCLTQEEIAAAAGVSSTIHRSGSRIDQLALAVTALEPRFVMMGRYNCDLHHLEHLLSLGLFPGVEWQGRFVFDKSHHQFDVGHYSIVTAIDRAAGLIYIVDPDDKSVFSHGVVGLEDFRARWWEDNEIVKGSKHRSFGLAFVVIPASMAAKVRVQGFEQVSYDFSMNSSIAL